MKRPKFLRALLIITALLLTSDHVNSDSLGPGTDECAICTSSAVAYWPMTSRVEGSDLSGNEHKVTFVGLTYTDGPSGEDSGAVHFSGGSNSFASVINSPSMDLGKYPGFSFSGFVRLGIQNHPGSLIDWSSSKEYGMFVTSSAQYIQLYLYPRHDVVRHKAEFPNMKLTAGSWHFFEISYNKATGIVTAFMDGQQEQNQLEKNIIAGTATSSRVGIGIDMSAPTEYNFNGDMSCMMLFNVPLTADDFKRVRKFCRRGTSTKKTPKITVLGVSRTDNKVTIHWKQLIGHYTAIKVKYCQTGTDDREYYIVQSPNETSASWFVDPDKTYEYYMMIEDGGKVVYTSDRLVAKTVIAPKMSVIGVSRTDNKVTIRWKELIGRYTSIKVKYCQTGTESCQYYITPRPINETSASWFVHPDKTYGYYVMIEDGSDVVYTSDRLVAKTVTAAKMSAIAMSRADNIVTIRWKQVIGRYTAIKIRYCQTGTESCVDYNVPNPNDTSATWLVDPDKTYYYYMVIEDGDDVVYTSNPLVVNDSGAKIDIVAVVGGSVTGAVILTALGVIFAGVLWKSRRSRKKLKKQVANYTSDDDAMRIALAAIKNSPRHTYANIGTAGVHAFSHSARTAKKYPAKPRTKMIYVPANRVGFENEPKSSEDDEDIDQYDYCTDTMWQQDASGSRHNPVPDCQTGHSTWKQEATAQIHVPAHQGDHSDPASTASSYQDMQAGVIVSIERQMKQEQEGTYNDVRIMAAHGVPQQCTTDSRLGQEATCQHFASCQNFIPSREADQDDPVDGSSNEDMSGQNVSQDSSYDDVRIVTQGEPAHGGRLDKETWQHKDMRELRPYVVCEKQIEQEPEGTYNDVRIITHGQPSLAVGGLDKARLAKKLTRSSPNDGEANDQKSHYWHLEREPMEPVSRHEYLDFRGLSPKQLKPQNVGANPSD